MPFSPVPPEPPCPTASTPPVAARRVPRRRASACPAQALGDLVAAVFALPASAVTARARGDADVAFARQTAMYLAHVAFGASYSEIGRAFGRDRTTAAHACRVVEERRDDPLVDAVVGRLERLLAAASRPAGARRRP